MQPIGPLMHEHRLIERVIELARRQAEAIQGGKEPDSKFIAETVDFFRIYADRCHHGKEEDLLFKELASKGLSSELSAIMDELIKEHQQGRALVGKLYRANQVHMKSGDNFDLLAALLDELCLFYPKHIEKEDKHFFFPVMEYFTRKEMDRMLGEFSDFDQQLIHGIYREKVEGWE